MKKFSLFLAVIALFSTLYANPVDVETAQSLGSKFMLANDRAESASLSLAYIGKTDAGIDAFYVFNCHPKGFVIVSADDRMRPILGYSTESKFDVVAAEEGPTVFFDAYYADLNTAIAENLEQSPEIATQWQMLGENGTLSGRYGRTIGPLCSSTWHQTQLYNDQCPEDDEGYNGHVKVGCVANAMGQLMRYWEWPKTGVGSHSYYCYGYGTTSYGTLTANFGEAEYHYELMPDFLDYTSPQAEVDAVALLEYHAGVSVEMDYGPNASGAYSGDVVPAFQQYFRYSNDADFVDRDDYSDQQWINLLKNEIDNGRPMYYSAYSYTKDATRGGHAFVCDGYDENDFFHYNWGWQGFDNGFYSINAMNLTHHAYNYNHYTTIDLHPNTDYNNQPKPVRDLEIEPWAYGMAATITMQAPSQTIGGTVLTAIDSVVVMMNHELIHTFVAPQPGENLEFEYWLDNEASGKVNYFTVYPVTSGGCGKSVTTALPMWNTAGGMSTPLTFHLFDSAGDGWLSPAISIIDERGVVQYRIGLDEGYESTVTVDIPVHCNLTLYWNYCNIGYEDDDAECSFEVYDYNGEMLFAQTDKPTVGELFSFYSDFDVVVAPDFITADGNRIQWGLENINQWFGYFVLERFLDPDGEPDESWNFYADQTEYVDEVEPGTYYYRVRAEYGAGGGVPQSSGYAPNLENPAIDYVTVEIDNVDEILSDDYISMKVYDVFGRLIYEGDLSSCDIKSLENGVVIVEYTTANGNTYTVKINILK